MYLDGARHLLTAFRPARFVFTGSTSVYAQTDGTWLDEAAPAAPDRETGRVLRATEDLVLAAPGGVVARLAGIYGPGRSNLLRKFFFGEAIIGGRRRTLAQPDSPPTTLAAAPAAPRTT